MSAIRAVSLVIVSAGIGVALGFLSFVQQPRSFESTARLAMPGLKTEPALPADAWLAKCRAELTSGSVVDEIIHRDEIRLLPGVMHAGDVHRLIEQHTYVEAVDGLPLVVAVRYQSASPHECQMVLEALLTAYVGQQSARLRQEAGKTAWLLANARQALQRLYVLEPPVSKSAPAAPAVEPASGSAELERRRQELLAARAQLEQRLANLETPPADGPDPSAITVTSDSLPQAQPAGPDEAARTRLAELLKEQRELSQEVGPDHPRLKALQFEIELFKKYPAQQAKLLNEEKSLLDQYGPSHPKVKEFQQKLGELGMRPSAAAVSPAAVSPAAAPVAPAPEVRRAAEVEALKAAIRQNSDDEARLSREIEAARPRPAATPPAAKAPPEKPAAAQASTDEALRQMKAALERLAELAPLEPAAAPYLVAAPDIGRRLTPGPIPALVISGAAGMAVGIALAAIVAWVSLRAEARRGR